MIDVMDATEQYLSHFNALEKSLGHSGDGCMHALRTAGMERFVEMGFPTDRDEEWRFTPVSKLADTSFQLADGDLSAKLTQAELDQVLLPTGPSQQIVLVNDSLAPQLSKVKNLPAGVQVCSLRTAIRAAGKLVESHLAMHVQSDDSPFVALNTAFLRDGIFVFLPRGTVLREPLHLVYVAESGTESTVCFPRTLIVCEGDTQATIVQSYLSYGDDKVESFTNAVTEMVLGANARIEHCKIQREFKTGYHFETMQIVQERGSNFASQNVTLGGAMTRNEIYAVLDGEGCECTLNGLYVGDDTQHIDNRTSIDHAKPHCNSHELYKGILSGKAKGVFNGKIFVRQDAQKTDAKQTNRTLLLSDEATINSKPQLEIFADDVKCTHGATVGQLADEGIFYLRSRGIGMEQARAILTYAFADEILQHIKIEPLRRDLETHFLAAQHLPADLREEEGSL